MNNDNILDFIIDVVFDTSHQIIGLGTKAQDLVITFSLGEGENISEFHLRALTIRSELDLLQDQTGKTKNLTGKYTMELSKLKHLKIYTTNFELYYRWFEHQPQIQHIYLTFTPKIEEIFEP